MAVWIFDYDAMGHRIAKHIYSPAWVLEKSTYYVLDAQGNQLSMYEFKPGVARGSFKYYLAERNIYGSQRLGTTGDTVNMILPNTLPSYGFAGNRSYELTNHLGNVLTSISDLVYPISSGGTDVDYYQVGINQVTDYSPFGVQLDGRTISGGIDGNYRYSFQGQEKDDEVKGEGNSLNYEYRMHDSRLGRFFAIDPLAVDYPWNSPYAFSENMVIHMVELEGLEAAKPNGDSPNKDSNPGPSSNPILGAWALKAQSMMNSEGDNKTRERGFTMLYPISASKIRKMAEYAGNFSINIGKATGRNENDGGTFRNAVRHTLWSALSTKSVGEKIAKLGTDSHETHTRNVDWSQRNFKKEDSFKADHLIDLMNNQIGREIGNENKGLTNQEIAIKVMDYYKDHGLWQRIQNKDGSYTIVKTLLSQSDYDKSIAEIKKKGENGLNAKKKQ